MTSTNMDGVTEKPFDPLAQTLTPPSTPDRPYDYVLKFLLVGDSDVGKQEILEGLDDGSLNDSPYDNYRGGIEHKTTNILLDGKKVKLQLWDASGQGRLYTIFHSYSRGAQGIILVYDITNKWSFDNIDRWIKEIEECAPGVPKILVGNRLHLAFKRQVSIDCAQAYALKNHMLLFEVSPLCDFNIIESLTELCRQTLLRNGMERLWKPNRVVSLQDLCCQRIVKCTSVYNVDRLPLPATLRSRLKSFSNANTQHLYLSATHRSKKARSVLNPYDSSPTNSRKSCVLM